jgi:hypothetical protein
VLTPFAIDQFGGLNLAADPTELGTGGATDLQNVDFDRPGQLRTRDGVTTAATITATKAGGMAAFETSTLSQAVVGYDSGGTHTYDARTVATGASVATAAPAASAVSAARFGDTTHDRLYIANGVDTMWRWDGAAFTQPAGMPVAKFATVKPDTSRLVGANLSTNTSRIMFSDPGAPETWPAVNWVDLTPGDGSGINGLAAWRELLFAFKRDRFFVFGVEGTLSDGTPVFYNRPVDRYGTALPPVSGDEGVYFCDGRTIWVTTGGVPTRISYPIERFLLSETTLGGSTVGTAAPVLGYADGRLYVTCSTATGSLGRLTLVYDPKVNAWMMFTYQTGTLGNGYVIALHRAASAPPTTYCFDGGGGVNPKLFSLVPGATADDATAIPWSYTTGYSSAGGYFRQRIVSSGVRKKHFKTDILGTATNAVTHQVLALNARANDVADTGGTVTLGSSATARGSRRRGARGTHFAQKLSGSGSATISNVTYYVSEIGQDS